MTKTALDTLAKVGFSEAPVAIAFLDGPPPGLARVDRPAAAGCGYWKHAADGHSFYTTADDHLNCAVGAFTHGVKMSADTSRELESLVGTMIQLHYLRPEEVPQIPHRTQPMQVAAYAPLSRATFSPDLVVFRGNPRQIMLLSEAARLAGAFESGHVMGRPACAMLPQVLDDGSAAASVACIGNRVYTDLGDNQLYLSVPGDALERMLDALQTIVAANDELERFHQARKAELTA